MKQHTVHGANILNEIDSPVTKMGQCIALNHHERWDGSGYPHGIRGEAIPLAARIMSICDVYDALRRKRPYKEAFSHERSQSIILNGDGQRTRPEHFDPQVLQAFEQCVATFDDVFKQHADAKK